MILPRIWTQCLHSYSHWLELAMSPCTSSQHVPSDQIRLGDSTTPEEIMDTGGQPGRSDPAANVSFHLILTLLLPLNLQPCVSLLTRFRSQGSFSPTLWPARFPTQLLRRIHLHCYEYRFWEELSRDLLSTNSEHLAFVGTCSQMAHHWFTIQFSYCEAKNVFCSVSLSAAAGRRQGKVPPLPNQTVRWLWGSPAAQTQKGWAHGEEGPDHASVKGLGRLCPLDSSRKGI